MTMLSRGYGSDALAGILTLILALVASGLTSSAPSTDVTCAEFHTPISYCPPWDPETSRVRLSCAGAQDSDITRNPWLALPSGGNAGDKLSPKSFLRRMRRVSGPVFIGTRTDTCWSTSLL